MIFYHGTTSKLIYYFFQISLERCSHQTDCGSGFYIITNLTQAKNFIKRGGVDP
ncbi:DUF3990 domain-containing protein [Siminovitchia acidinfaciens]|uniref:DUF3990 domain-containing protein n=1 Tax=Siminovitchia acidinfaciens TaxID=2321395 RepID=A0A429XW72_9BACI|nr:DUF3990 domain-containing protein [Siminovitchia acidinfaciens]